MVKSLTVCVCISIKGIYLNILNKIWTRSVRIHLVIAEEVQAARVDSLSENMLSQGLWHDIS